MLGEIGIKCGAALHAGAVMFDDFFERLETTVVHVGRGESDVAQRRRGELALVGIFASDFRAAKVLEFGIESVVGQGLALEQWAAVTMETVRSELLATRVVLGHEEFKAALLVG